MKQYPSIPHVESTPDDMFEGHLWLVEKVDGAHFRFQLQEAGYIRFGDRSEVYDAPEAVPPPYQHAVRAIQKQFDRAALRQAVENVEDVVFFGEAMHQHRIEYDWDRTPSFLGYDIWSAETEAFRPLATTEKIFQAVGLQPVHVFERERNARDFQPETYTIPQSAYYDGPAEGVIIRNKRGQRTQRIHPAFEAADEPAPVEVSAETLAARYATQQRFETLVAELETQGQPVTVDTLYEHVLEDIMREEHRTLFEGAQSVEMSEFRSDIAARTRSFLDERTTY